MWSANCRCPRCSARKARCPPPIARCCRPEHAAVSEFRNFIGGEWTPATGGSVTENRNPADTRELVGVFAASQPEDAQAAVDAAARAFPAWSATPIGKRAQVLQKAADWLDAHAESIAQELTREMGKPLALAKDEIARTAQTFRF